MARKSESLATDLATMVRDEDSPLHDAIVEVVEDNTGA
jgi:hypothetical protein